MKTKSILLLFLSALLSCEKNVTIDVPYENPKLVVNGMIRNATGFRVTVGKSTGILDLATTADYAVNNALVQLYEDDVLKDTLRYDSMANAYFTQRGIIARAGKKYKLRAAAKGYLTVDAETQSPFNTLIESITRRTNIRKDADGNFLDEIKITFRDTGAFNNYFLFRVRRPTSVNGPAVNYTGVSCMHSADVDVERRNNTDPVDFDKCINQQFFMTDANFNGRTKELLLFINHDDMEPLLNTTSKRYFRPFIELQTITYDYYKYLKSYYTYRDANDNPFAEPVLVYANVNNGYGIFTTYDLSRDSIR